MKLKRKPGKLAFAILYIVCSIAIFYIVLWVWQPNFFIMLQDLSNQWESLVDERLVLLSGILILPSLLIIKGKKFVSIKFAAIVSGFWVLFMLITLVLSVTTAQVIVAFMKKYLTKPALFISVLSMVFWSYIELLNTGEKKR